MIKEMMRPLGSVTPQSFLLGVGVAALAHMIAPHMKTMIRPAAVKSVQGIMAMGNMSKQVFEGGREKLNNMIFEKEADDKNAMTAQALQETLLKELKEEREMSNMLMKELKNTLQGLKDEISSIKNGPVPEKG